MGEIQSPKIIYTSIDDYTKSDLYVYIQNSLYEEDAFFLVMSYLNFKITGSLNNHIKLELSFLVRNLEIEDKLKTLKSVMGSNNKFYTYYIRAYFKKSNGKTTSQEVIFSGNLESLDINSDSSFIIKAESDSKRLDGDKMFIDYGTNIKPIKTIENVISAYNSKLKEVFLDKDNTKISTKNLEITLIKSEPDKEEDKIDHPFIEYEETFWEFFKRLLSHINTPIYQSGTTLKIGLKHVNKDDIKEEEYKKMNFIMEEGFKGELNTKKIYSLGDLIGVRSKKESFVNVCCVDTLEIEVNSDRGINAVYKLVDIDKYKAQVITLEKLTRLEGTMVGVKSTSELPNDIQKEMVNNNKTKNEIMIMNQNIKKQVESLNVITLYDKEKLKEYPILTNLDEDQFNEEKEKIINGLNINIEVNNKAINEITILNQRLQEENEIKYACVTVDFQKYLKNLGTNKVIPQLNDLDGKFGDALVRYEYPFITNYNNSKGQRDFTSAPKSGENVLVDFTSRGETSGIVYGAVKNNGDDAFISDNPNLNSNSATLKVEENMKLHAQNNTDISADSVLIAKGSSETHIGK